MTTTYTAGGHSSAAALVEIPVRGREKPLMLERFAVEFIRNELSRSGMDCVQAEAPIGDNGTEPVRFHFTAAREIVAVPPEHWRDAELEIQAKKRSAPSIDDPRFELWHHFSKEHGVTLMESELDDIILAVETYQGRIRARADDGLARRFSALAFVNSFARGECSVAVFVERYGADDGMKILQDLHFNGLISRYDTGNVRPTIRPT